MALKTFFSGGVIARGINVRDNPVELNAAWQDPASRFVVLWQSRCLVENSATRLLNHAELGMTVALADTVYLGQRANQHLFGIALADDLAGTALNESAFNNFRGLLSELNAQDAALLAYAKGMLEWRARHRHCGKCGAVNDSASGGFVMACSNSACGNRSFPRIDPAIIVLVIDQHDDNRCLLGRQQSWPEGRYSTIAGFVEPGESLEDAVAREVHEETNIIATAAQYLGSQPWPFPTGMMIGFHASADSSRAIVRHDAELADARWLSREQLAAGEVVLPPTTSIAFRLIEDWFDRWDGPSLASYRLSGDFSRRTGERN